MSGSDTIKEVFEGGIYGKVRVDLCPPDPRKEKDCVGTLIGLNPRTEYLTDQHASRYGLLQVVRQHPRFRPNWENEDHRAYRDFSDIAVLADTARQLGFLVLPMDIDTSGYGSVYLGHFDDSVDDYNCLMYVPQFGVWKEWGKGPKAYRKARNYLLCEIEEFEQYLINGDVFGVEVGTYHIDVSDNECDDEGQVLHEVESEMLYGVFGKDWAEVEMDSMMQQLRIRHQRTCPVLAEIQA